MIGTFGNIVFETSDKRILNFSGLTRESSGRFSIHEVISQKPYTEFIGPNLDVITFTVSINGLYGLNPREEMDKWVTLASTGQAYTLVIGDKALGSDKWVLKSISEAWNTILNDGKLLSGKVDVTLEEYMSSITLSPVKATAEITLKTSSSNNVSLYGYVTATRLNVRNGPGIKYKILGQLSKGEKVTILENGSWYKINYNGAFAYVYSKYIRLGWSGWLILIMWLFK